ncbi:acyltransferase family protein [Pseudohoeflea suaedae]|uniref:acyltransferase family protein n=1 Tax=Pseudohoeflea suaedae TaxID=877384 RepID=UPI001304B20C|nr:acyltransferase [Pseudohoeflea suaedae]
MIQGNLIPAVQYLRGFAALAVFLFHVSSLTVATWGPNAAGIDHVGAAGVDLFFVISGFVMVMIVSRPGAFRPGDFIFRRLARVVPGYYIATLAVFLLAIAVPSILGSTTADVARLAASLAFVPWPDGEGAMAPLLLVGWTLNYEMFFYALVLLMAGLFGDRKLYGLVAVVSALAFVGWVAEPENGTLAFYTDAILLEFAFGILVWHLHRYLSDEGRDVVYFVSFFAGTLFLALQHETDPGNYRTLYWGIPGAMILLGGLRMMRFSSPAMAALGDWSYAFYLTHLFVIAGYIRIVMPHMPDLGLMWLWHYSAMTAIALTVAWTFHRFIEVPLNRLVVRRFAARGAGPVLQPRMTAKA